MSATDPQGGVLCAGFGTRMEPLTDSVPKPLLPFLNTPILTYALDNLASAGVERVGMNLHHLPEAIPPVADRLCESFGLETSYAREWEIMGTAGGIRGIWRALGEPDAPLVVTNGDSVLNIDLEEHIRGHREAGAAVTLVVRPRADEQPGNVWLDAESSRLERLREFRAPSERSDEQLEEYDFTGLHILEPSVLSDVPLEPGDIIEDVYGPMLEEGASIRTSVHNDFWAALDNPGLLMSTTREILDDPDLFEQAPLDSEIDDGIYAADPETIPSDVELQPPVFFGENVELEPGAEIGPYAVVDGVTVREGAEIEHAVLYGVGDVEDDRRECVAVADQIARL